MRYIQSRDWKSYFQPNILTALFATIILIALYQFALKIPAPGLKLTAPTYQEDFMALLNMVSGGGLKKASLFAVGISPYITSQIILQMLSNGFIKPLVQLKKEGEVGRIKLEFYTRLLTLPFAFLTAYGTLILISNSSTIKFTTLSNENINSLSQVPEIQQAFYIFYFVAGTYLALFIADIITKKGIGNGITILIMSGVIIGIPEHFTSAYKIFQLQNLFTAEKIQFLIFFKFIIYSFFYIGAFVLVIFVNGAVRRIPVQQTGQGIVANENELPYLPIKLITVGVIPVIFAGAIMVIPEAIGQLLKSRSYAINEVALSYFSLSHPFGIFLYALLIIFLSFFYSQLQLNPQEMSENFVKSGRFIPGVPLREQTALYLEKAIKQVNWVGAPMLAMIAILPNIINILSSLPSNIAMGGTGVIILVSGSIQIWESLRSIATTGNYRLHKGSQRPLFTDRDNKKNNNIELW